MTFATPASLRSLAKLNFKGDNIRYQPTPSELIQKTLDKGQGVLNDSGALVIRTGKFTGRSPKDKYIVFDETVKGNVDWNEFNNPIDPKYFDSILAQAVDYLNHQEEIYVRDAYACADSKYSLSFRVINEFPSMNLFVHNMLLSPTENIPCAKADWHIISVPGLELKPVKSGTRQANATIISFSKRIILIVGSGYTGEIKKSIFTVLNYLLPVQEKVLPMHCAANEGTKGSIALFFGLSGTGKTTLSTDTSRRLIGDDEHGWGSEGIFNFEGGCYAKCINLSEKNEPEVFNAIRPGALVENTTFYPNSDRINFNDPSITENTRVSYPLSYIVNRVPEAKGGIPDNIIFLTCDAFGVLPPVSKLTTEQALYYFLNGYTAKVAGTEEGITEPKATFSACFGAPFMPLHPMVYAKMLEEKISKHHVKVWMVNTGWTGGGYGVGERIPLKTSRAIINAVLTDQLEKVDYKKEEVFGLDVPTHCPGVIDALLQPRNVWKDKNAYDRQAQKLMNYFISNYSKFLDNGYTNSFENIKQ